MNCEEWGMSTVRRMRSCSATLPLPHSHPFSQQNIVKSANSLIQEGCYSLTLWTAETQPVFFSRSQEDSGRSRAARRQRWE